MKLKKLAQLVALMGVVGPVMAQEAAAPALQRVEVTGSSIKRVAKEGALPVQVITFDQIEKQGITTTEQLVRTLSANGTGADKKTTGATPWNSRPGAIWTSIPPRVAPQASDHVTEKGIHSKKLWLGKHFSLAGCGCIALL